MDSAARNAFGDRLYVAVGVDRHLVLERVSLLLARVVRLLIVYNAARLVFAVLRAPDALLLGVNDQSHIREGVHDRRRSARRQAALCARS